MATVSSPCDLATARDILRRLPGILAGHAPDPWGIVRAIGLRIGYVLLSKVQQAILVRSRGGVAEDGIKWAPLKPATVAARRQGKAGRKGRGGRKGKRKPPGQADIGRDTSRMFNSLAPGVPGTRKPDQIADAPAGKVVVGTVVPYATYFHHGAPRRNIPARPLWPLDGSVPPGWSRAMLEALKRGVVLAIADVLGRARP